MEVQLQLCCRRQQLLVKGCGVCREVLACQLEQRLALTPGKAAAAVWQ